MQKITRSELELTPLWHQLIFCTAICAQYPDLLDKPCCQIVNSIRFRSMSKTIGSMITSGSLLPQDIPLIPKTWTCTEKEGNQILDFYWNNPIEASQLYICKKQYNRKFYTGYTGELAALHWQNKFGARFPISPSSGCWQLASFDYLLRWCIVFWPEHEPSSHLLWESSLFY